MANTTGHKFGGRQKGTPNKLTRELRSLLKDILYDELVNIEDRLNDLETKERIELVIKLMPFVFPKVVSVSSKENEPFDWGLG
tara:strand:+ start:288 stop:536 length:249 start_codon:yes stop_codon:yes gene_type:complete